MINDSNYQPPKTSGINDNYNQRKSKNCVFLPKTQQKSQLPGHH
jgi:hypothetical protein